MNHLSGKVALVTGAAKNLGRAIAVDLAIQGAKVAVHYLRSTKEASETLTKVKSHSQGISVCANVTDPVEISSMIKTIEMKLGSVDILVNTIGNFIFDSITATSFEKFRDVTESH